MDVRELQGQASSEAWREEGLERGSCGVRKQEIESRSEEHDERRGVLRGPIIVQHTVNDAQDVDSFRM